MLVNAIKIFKIALALSARAEYIYSAASQATRRDGVYILRDVQPVVT
jgi:hypothetical protein